MFQTIDRQFLNYSDATTKILLFSFDLLEARKSLEKSEYKAKIEAMGLKKNSPELRTHLKIGQIFFGFKDKVELIENILPGTIYKLTQKRYVPVVELLLSSPTALTQVDVENMMSQLRGDRKTTSRGWNTDSNGNQYLKTESPRIYDEQAGEAMLLFEKTGLNRQEIFTTALQIVYGIHQETGKSLQEMKGESLQEQIQVEIPLQQDEVEENHQTWKEFQIDTLRNRLIRDDVIPQINSTTYQSVTKLACQAQSYSQLIETIDLQEYDSNEDEIFQEAISSIKNEQNNCINQAKNIAIDAGYEIIEDKLVNHNELVWQCAPEVDVIAQELILAINPIRYQEVFQPEEIIKKAITQEISWDSLKKALFSIYEFTQNNPHHYLESVLSQFDIQTRTNVREVLPESFIKLEHSLIKGQIFDYVYLLPQNLVLIRYSEVEQEVIPECLVEKRLNNIVIDSYCSQVG